MPYPLNFSEILEALKNLSFKAMGYSSPNPPVACVITDLEGKILSKAHTQKTGGNHAEREAYKNFALEFPDCKSIPHLVFVTLEPCTHFGKTPPCIDLILEYKPSCVYYGLSDPNPLVQKRNGLEECLRAGIEILHSPEIEKISRTFLSGFISRIKKKRPQIFIKTALSKEGFYSDLTKTKISLSNSKSNQMTQMLRAKVDAVLVGPGTVHTDLPSLNFRGFDNSEILSLEKMRTNFKPNMLTENWEYSLTQSIFENTMTIDSVQFHNTNYKDYQPFRIFVVSCNQLPKDFFFEKQTLLNKELQSKKVLFFLLDFEKENPIHEKLYGTLSGISLEHPVIISKKEELQRKIFQKFTDLSLNTVLVEGGNLFYKMFSENLDKNDLVYFIHTDRSITKGILPAINLKDTKKMFEIQLEKNTWEVYGS